MEKKTFQVNAVYIITYMKGAEPQIFVSTNALKEFDFVKASFDVEGIGFNEDKAKEKMRSFLVSNVLKKGTFTNSQKVIFSKAAVRTYNARYFVNLTEPKLALKNGGFYYTHKLIGSKNKLSDTLREFLVNYVSEKRGMNETAED